MIQPHESGAPETLAVTCDNGPVRVFVMRHVQDDTYAIFENGDISLSDRAHLIQMLKQLSGRGDP